MFSYDIIDWQTEVERYSRCIVYEILQAKSYV